MRTSLRLTVLPLVFLSVGLALAAERGAPDPRVRPVRIEILFDRLSFPRLDPMQPSASATCDLDWDLTAAGPDGRPVVYRGSDHDGPLAMRFTGERGYLMGFHPEKMALGTLSVRVRVAFGYYRTPEGGGTAAWRQGEQTLAGSFAIGKSTGLVRMLVRLADEKPGPREVASGLTWPVSLVLDAGNVYFRDDWTLSAVVKKVAKTGGPVTVLSGGISSSHRGTENLFRDGTALYGDFGDFDVNTIFQVPTAGGPLQQAVVTGGGNLVGVSAGGLFYSSGFSTVYRIPLAGGPAAYAFGGYFVRGHAADDSGVYFVNYGDRILRRYDPATRAVTTIIAGNASEGAPFLDRENVFLQTADGLKRVAKAGGPVTQLVVSGTISGAASDGKHVYFFDSDRVKRVPVAGGPIQDLAPAKGWVAPADLAVDDEYVYWADKSAGMGAGKIMRLAKSAGGAAPAPLPEKLAVGPEVKVAALR